MKNTKKIEYSEHRTDTLVCTDSASPSAKRLKKSFHNETKTLKSSKNDLVKTAKLKLPIAHPQVNESADEKFDPLLIVFNLNINMCLQPASEFDNFYSLNADADKALYD